jgi:hypothetical protein
MFEEKLNSFITPFCILAIISPADQPQFRMAVHRTQINLNCAKVVSKLDVPSEVAIGPASCPSLRTSPRLTDILDHFRVYYICLKTAHSVFEKLVRRCDSVEQQLGWLCSAAGYS